MSWLIWLWARWRRVRKVESLRIEHERDVLVVYLPMRATPEYRRLLGEELKHITSTRVLVMDSGVTLSVLHLPRLLAGPAPKRAGEGRP